MAIYKVTIEKIECSSVEIETIGEESAEALAIILEEEGMVKWKNKKIEIKNIEEIQ